MFSVLRHWTGRNRTDSRPAGRVTDCYASRCSAILHIDIVESTRQVIRNPRFAHLQIRHLYARLLRIAHLHQVRNWEFRGDAAVIEFATANDAIMAALAIHSANTVMDNTRIGKINPPIRTGISFGEVIGDSNMITGEAIIRAQRLEQLADPGQVLFDQTARSNLEDSPGLTIKPLFEKCLKGFSHPVAVFQAIPGSSIRLLNEGGYLGSLARTLTDNAAGPAQFRDQRL